MSLLGSLNAAVGGLNAQSAALSSISDNVANSQTIAFKGTNTAFVDYITQSSANSHSPGAVVARPRYTNSQQGSVVQVSNPTSLAVAGAGYFTVQRPTGEATFNPQPYYTRVGDFEPNSAGFLVNSAGYALNGWTERDATGTQFNTNVVRPIQINKAPSPPVATSNIDLAANLPSGTAPGASYTSPIQVYDGGGNPRDVTLTWSNPQATAAGATWDLNITSAGSTTPLLAAAPLTVTFGNLPADAGTIKSITAGGTPISAAQNPGDPATINLAADYGFGSQPITLAMGNFGQPNGVTQFAGSNYEVTTQNPNGAPKGNYSSTNVRPTGDVVINYDNGQSVTVARVPLVNFNNPNALQQQDGQAFTETRDSGEANSFTAGAGGTGTLVVGAQESSNVDIAAQFTQMIVAQRAYTANTKVVSTANSMLQDTFNMVQG